MQQPKCSVMEHEADWYLKTPLRSKASGFDYWNSGNSDSEFKAADVKYNSRSAP